MRKLQSETRRGWYLIGHAPGYARFEEEVVPVVEPLEKLSKRGYSRYEVFTDWLDLMLYALQRRDDPYLEIVHGYNNDQNRGSRDIDLFHEAFHQLQQRMAEAEADLLGIVYEELGMSSDAFGQYFTPQNICEMMADMQLPDCLDKREEPYRIADPACGSGRLLIEAAKRIDQPAVFHGQDKDPVCVKMTALNLCFFNVDGVAILGDSLTMETRKAWQTQHSPWGGSVHELDTDELEDAPIEGQGGDRSEVQKTGQLQLQEAIQG